MSLSEINPNEFGAFKTSFYPQPEMLEVENAKQQITIGILKELNPHEYRVPLTPLSVELLTANGHRVLVQSNIGAESNYLDSEYSEAGAEIKYTAEEVFQADILIKIAPLTMPEMSLLRGKQTLISSLNLATQKKQYISKLIEKKITAIAFELIKDSRDSFPIVQSMSEISGSAAIITAANYLSKTSGGKGVLLGSAAGITPTEIIILGAGIAAEQAAKAAGALGAVVKVFDNSISKLRSLERHMGYPIFTSVYHPQVIEKALLSADVVIGALTLDDQGSWFTISEEMVKSMKPGSVIIDLSVDSGACFETSELTNLGKPTYQRYGITHYCVPNIASTVSRTASIALSNVLAPIVINIGERGGVAAELHSNTGVRNGVFIFRGILTNALIAKKFKMPSQNIDLLMAAF